MVCFGRVPQLASTHLRNFARECQTSHSDQKRCTSRVGSRVASLPKKAQPDLWSVGHKRRVRRSWPEKKREITRCATLTAAALSVKVLREPDRSGEARTAGIMLKDRVSCNTIVTTRSVVVDTEQCSPLVLWCVATATMFVRLVNKQTCACCCGIPDVPRDVCFFPVCTERRSVRVDRTSTTSLARTGMAATSHS